ncbi:N-acetyl-gamma-glutamyl-phosphate reductase [Desulfallas thermosapovorans]|uniref:N-acetyl-gamma-glutamyl-phosphate reductase n=1 Tax=Desulfallas thermosapovorans DSM 6562 TaxID=1121431 RepID=A0A5S4ZR04_9FIRM|nr:N-acetyl-gamma-glutamyl-phosphate reductase [Desulfallas thermosapovorans]TYO94439.1 N-acetyl-gamma-glutamyl-phosphate reductase [Desulfallas thermosapovorans DSM 6562]
MKIKVGIIGATGYAGAELVRLLSAHPEAELVALTTQSYGGKSFCEVYPHLYKYVDQKCCELDIPDLVGKADVIFAALPHGHAIPVAREVLKQGKKFIDLGADFRFDRREVYEQWYKVEHTAPDLLEQKVYGLPEVYREKIKSASLVGNPGCYPTSVILGLAPLLKHGLVDTGTVVADSKSGVSGAGRGLSLGNHFCEVNENFRAYNVGMHRHTPEIEQELGKLAGEEMVISFTPHLTPMNRGILSTVYAKLKQEMTLGQVRSIYEEYYRSEFFVRLLPPGILPQTKAVAGSNHCDVVPVVDPRTGRVVVISAIDNLIKGAAGQAVQNMNLMFGLPEITGLNRPGLYP